MNHVTVMFRKKSVLEAGNYMSWHYNEDYILWIKMFENGCKFYNIQKNLVNVRVGEEMYKRRGGLKYFKSEQAIQKYMLKNNIQQKSIVFCLTMTFNLKILNRNED